MKRIISFTLTLSLCFALLIGIPLPTFASSNVIGPFTITATEYRDYVCNDGSLTSNNIIEYGVLSNTTVSWDGSSIAITGSVSLPFSFLIIINNGEIEETVDLCSNYSILSVLPQDNDNLCIIAKQTDCNTIIYIYIKTLSGININPYNINWYTDFVTPQIFEVPSISPLGAGQETTTRTYTSYTEVLAATIYEYLEIHIDYDWDPIINNSTGGDFKSILVVYDSYTTYNLVNGSQQTYENCSLCVEDAIFHAATPTGEYIFEGAVHPRSQEVEFGGIYVDFGISIPKTPFSVGVTLPRRSYIQDPTHFNKYSFSYTPASGEELLAVSLEMDGFLQFENDNYDIVLTIKTDLDSQVLGSKMLQTRWDFVIRSDGSAGNTAVTPFSRNDSCSRNMVYQLTSAY